MDRLLLTVAEAADRIGAGRSFFYGLLAEGQIESVKLGRRRLVPVDAIDAFVARVRSEQAGVAFSHRRPEARARRDATPAAQTGADADTQHAHSADHGGVGGRS